MFVGGSGEGAGVFPGEGAFPGDGAGVFPGDGAGVGDGMGEGVGARVGATTSCTSTVRLVVLVMTLVKLVLFFKAVTKLSEKLFLFSLKCVAAASISVCGASIVTVATTEPADKLVFLIYSFFTPVDTKLSSTVVMTACLAESSATNVE